MALPVGAQAVDIDAPKIALESVPFEIVVGEVVAGADVVVEIGGKTHRGVASDDGVATIGGLVAAELGAVDITATSDGRSSTASLRVLPGWISLMPAFLAIAVALLLRNVVPALVLGLWLGATALQGFSPLGALQGLMDVLAVFIVNALADPDHAAIIVFTMMIGGMVGIITRNGGMASIVRVVVSKAKTASGGQVSVWFMGLMIFFDDYANTLVVGNTARSVTDHLKISREKLAYIVDSTAAPVVSIALVTTWIGYQVSLIDQAMQEIDGRQERLHTQCSCIQFLTASTRSSRSVLSWPSHGVGATWARCMRRNCEHALVLWNRNPGIRCPRLMVIRSIRNRMYRCAR